MAFKKGQLVVRTWEKKVVGVVTEDEDYRKYVRVDFGNSPMLQHPVYLAADLEPPPQEVLFDKIYVRLNS
jgi:hypothetical protein